MFFLLFYDIPFRELHGINCTLITALRAVLCREIILRVEKVYDNNKPRISALVHYNKLFQEER